MNSTDLRILAQKVGVPIKKLSSMTANTIKVAPQAQKRTATFKKAVKIVRDRVFKGPFTFNDTQFMDSLRYTHALELLEATLQLPEWKRGSLRWEYIGFGDDDRYYLVAPNVGKRENIPFELVTTKIETNAKVVPRGGHANRVSEIEGTGLLTDDIKLATLQHLYLRFLLDIGDSGTHNILVREDYDLSGRIIAGIDLEEKRAIKEKVLRLDHLFKRGPSRKQIRFYQSDVCKIKPLSYSHLDPQTLGSLNAVGIDLERLKENMELWKSLK